MDMPPRFGRAARIALQNFRREQQVALDEERPIRGSKPSPAGSQATGRRANPYREHVVAALRLPRPREARPELFYLHRVVELYGQIIVSPCRSTREEGTVELPEFGPDPWWIRTQPHDWYARRAISVALSEVERCVWRGVVQSSVLRWQLGRLIPGDHHADL